MAHASEKDPNDKLKRASAIADWLRSFNLENHPAWASLDALSSKTRFEGVDVDPEGIILEPDNTFSGIMNVYVLLQYDPESEGAFADSASFLGQFEGHLDHFGQPQIDNVTVNTDPFFGEHADS